MVKHLELPQQGQSTEWILEEMSRMDKEAGAGSESKDGGRVDWREGKVSGAIYCTYFHFHFVSLIPISAFILVIPRWQYRPNLCDPRYM